MFTKSTTETRHCHYYYFLMEVLITTHEVVLLKKNYESESYEDLARNTDLKKMAEEHAS